MQFWGNSRDRSTPAKTWSAWLYLLMGAGAAVVGLLPWLITGMRLPLQNLWADDTLTEQMPFALLPFSNYLITLLVGVLAVGAAVAGVIGRATARHRPRFGVLALAGGVLAVQLLATIQTSTTVSEGSRATDSTDLYVYGLLAGTLATIAVGMLILTLIARAPKPGALVGVALAAVALGPWLSGLALPAPLVPYATDLNGFLLDVVQWIPAILVGVVIAWCGVNTVGKVLAALFSLLALWIGPTLFTAVSSAVGTRSLARYPAEMLDYGTQVFTMALGIPAVALRYVLVAAVVAVIGIVVRLMGAQRRRAIG